MREDSSLAQLLRARAMLASVFSPPAVRSKRTPATPTLVTGVTPGAYGRRVRVSLKHIFHHFELNPE